MDFYNNVKKLVKAKTDLTLRAFIEGLGINYDTYNGQKRYSNLPRADEALKIAQGLGVSVEYLLTGNEGGDERETVERIKGLLSQAQEMLDTI